MSKDELAGVVIYGDDTGRLAATAHSEARFTLGGFTNEEVAAVVAYIHAQAVEGELTLGRMGMVGRTTEELVLRQGRINGLKVLAKAFQDDCAKYRKSVAEGEIR